VAVLMAELDVSRYELLTSSKWHKKGLHGWCLAVSKEDSSATLIWDNLLHRLHSCYNTTIWTILLQKRHPASQSQVVKHTAGHDDLAHLLWSTSGLYTGTFLHLLASPSGRCLGRTTASTESINPQ
ncbi:hypothetical protein NDU88_005874, partial [Pleurodeles waltl]